MAFGIPSLLLKQLYTLGSLENADTGVRFSVKNRLSDATLKGVQRVMFDGKQVPLRQLPWIWETAKRFRPRRWPIIL